jgi:hypothetical protein
MRSNTLERRSLLAVAIVCGLSFVAARVSGAQESTFDWVSAKDENVRLDPADYYTGRVFKPADNAGNVHLDIDAQEPVTVEMAPSGQWNEAMRHPELLPRVTFRCVREHVTAATFVCDVPPARPMTLVVHDERSSEQTTVTSFGSAPSDHGTVRDFISPNDIHIQYYRWACVENCSPPRYQWMPELKENYQLSSQTKVYEGLIAERDGEPFSVRISSPVAMTVAIIPSPAAQELSQKPETLGAALQGRSCVEKSVRSAAFECMFDIADGPQSFIAVPVSDAKLPPNSKAEVEVVASKCVANCLTDIDK